MEIVEKSIDMERRWFSVGKPRKEQIPKLRALWKEAFGDTDDFLDSFFETAFDKERCRCVVIDGEVAAALYWFDCDVKDEAEHATKLQVAEASTNTKADLQAASLEIVNADLHAVSMELSQIVEKPNHRIAYIYAVATAEKFRGKGICHKLMEDTHKYLKEYGYEGAILVPGNEGLFRFYEGIGYRTCSYIREFQCIGEAKNIAFEQIDIEKYAMLRRAYLPEGGVVQEGANLDFLKTQAMIYAGKDFVLAARKEGDILHGMELLGNEEVASAVVLALGCKEGTFRCQVRRREGCGESYLGVLEEKLWDMTCDEKEISMPFGMFYPLKENSKVPRYFGLAFD